jgi:hypothetical protein
MLLYYKLGLMEECPHVLFDTKYTTIRRQNFPSVLSKIKSLKIKAIFGRTQDSIHYLLKKTKAIKRQFIRKNTKKKKPKIQSKTKKKPKIQSKIKRT